MTTEQPLSVALVDDQHLHAFLLRLPRSVQLLSPEGRTIAVNGAWERLWGTTLADLAGYRIRDDRQLREKGPAALLERAFAGEAVEIPTIPYVLGFGPAAGQTRWVKATATPVLDDRGAVALVALIHEDVSETVVATERLARVRELLEESQRSARVGTWEWDVRAGELIWTEELYRVYGLQVGEPLDYARFLSLVHTDDRPVLLAAVEEARRGEAFALDHRIIRPDGVMRWLHGRGRGVLDDDGALLRLVGSGQDVTDRVEAEAGRARRLAAQRALAEASRAFAEAESNVAALLETVARHASTAVGDGSTIWLFDDDGARLRAVAAHHPNPEAARATRERYAEVEHDASAGLVSRAATTGEAVFLPALDPSVLGACVHSADRGLLDEFPAFGLIAAPLRARGRVLGVLGASRSAPGHPYERDDLALLQELGDRAALAIDNARLYADAQAAEQRYRGLFAGVADAILIADDQARYQDANAAAESLLGYARHELLALRVEDVVASGSAWTQAEYARYVADGRWQGELELRRKDGATVPVEAVATIVQLLDGPVYLSVVRDISERKRAERLQRDVLAMVSHDLRSPLTSLRANAQLLQRRQEYRAAGVEAILAGADRMARLIDDLADVVRLEEGQLPLSRRTMDLAALVRQQADATRQANEYARIRVEAPDGRVMGSWDPDRLAQVLQNLLGNAVTHAPQGGIAVRLAEVGAEIRIAVVDQGPGIDPAHLPRLFERFYRADATGAGGLGLGLYISRMLIEAHGGRIWAESELGCGTTFTVGLPRS